MEGEGSSLPLLLDLADELWFSSSVVPFPSFSLPSLPPLFSSLFSQSPDSSTLLAQLMFSTTHSHSPSSTTPLQRPLAQKQYISPGNLPAYIHAYPAPSQAEDEDAYFVPGYGEGGDVYRGTCYDKDENEYPRYGNIKDAHPVPSYGEDEDAFHAHSAPDSDGVDSENAVMIVEKQHIDQDMEVGAALTDVPRTPAEDAFSGVLHDVGALLRDQQQCHQGKEDVQYYKWRQYMLDDAVLPESIWPLQADGKERKNVGINGETNESCSKKNIQEDSRQYRGVLNDDDDNFIVFVCTKSHKGLARIVHPSKFRGCILQVMQQANERNLFAGLPK